MREKPLKRHLFQKAKRGYSLWPALVGMSMKIKVIFILVFCVFPLLPAYSAVIIKIKGRKALIDLEGIKAEKGDTFSALNLYGKALGLLRVKKVKRGKAIAILLKGKMGPNWILEPGAEESRRFLASVDDFHKSGHSDMYASPRASTKNQVFPSSGFGMVTGPYLNFIKLSEKTRIQGYSFSGTLMMDFSFMDGDIVEPGLRLFVGYRQLRAKGTDCGRFSPCSLMVHYPGGGFLLRAVFLKRSMFQPWVGGGGFLFWPLVDQKADLGLDKKSFQSFHGSLMGALGMDFHFKGFYIPVQVDISWINPVLISFQSVKPNSKEFKPVYIGAKLGIAFPF